MSEPIEVFKTSLAFDGEVPGAVYQMDTIEIDGAYWLVPKWVEAPDGNTKEPERIIRLAQFDHEEMIGSPIGDFVVRLPVPKALFYSLAPELEAPGFEVRLHPARRMRPTQ